MLRRAYITEMITEVVLHRGASKNTAEDLEWPSSEPTGKDCSELSQVSADIMWTRPEDTLNISYDRYSTPIQ